MYQTAFDEKEELTQMWHTVTDVMTADDSAWVDSPDSDSPKLTVVCNSNGLTAEKLIRNHGFIVSNNQGTDPSTVRLVTFP